MTDPVEIIARQLAANQFGKADTWRYHEANAGRIAAALEAAGYRIAQREPTKEMVRAISGLGEMAVRVNGYRLLWDALPKHGGKP